MRRAGVRRLGALGLGAAAGLAAIAVPAAAGAAANGSAQGVLQQAVSSMDHASSGHLVINVDRGGAHSTETIDIGPHGGTATAIESGQTLHILYTGHTVYLQGKPAVLTSVLGMPPKTAAKYGGKWLSAPTTLGGMSQLSQLFSLSTYGQSLISLTGPLTKTGSQTAPSGQAAIKVTGSIPKTAINQASGGDHATVLVTASGAHYPISVAFSDHTSGSTHIAFSNWGEKLPIKVPANAVPSSQWAPQSPSQSG